MSRSQFMVRVWILKICVRLSKSGSPNSTLRSSRPGLNRAGSKVSGLGPHVKKGGRSNGFKYRDGFGWVGVSLRSYRLLHKEAPREVSFEMATD